MNSGTTKVLMGNGRPQTKRRPVSDPVNLSVCQGPAVVTKHARKKETKISGVYAGWKLSGVCLERLCKPLSSVFAVKKLKHPSNSAFRSNTRHILCADYQCFQNSNFDTCNKAIHFLVQQLRQQVCRSVSAFPVPAEVEYTNTTELS